MRCGDCKFSLLCWSGRLGTDFETRRNMSLCPCCDRLTLHFMDAPVAFLDDKPDEIIRFADAEARSRSDRVTPVTTLTTQERHFIFYCEHRRMDEKAAATWMHIMGRGITEKDWYSDGNLYNHSYIDITFDLPGRCEVRPCFPCAGYKRRGFNARTIELEPVRKPKPKR